MDQSYKDLPITALCILAEKSKCPVRYVVVEKANDTNTEIDLWKDGLFDKKKNRFICFTKEYPINNTYNVVEDLKLFSERENVPHGYIPMEKTDDTGEKALQRKILYAKISLRYYTNEAISDIIFLAKSKKAPIGYLLVGEINNYALCVKYSSIQKQQQQNTPMAGVGKIGYSPGYPQATPPPLPPRPPSANALNMQMPSLNTKQNNDIYQTAKRIYESADSYNPLLGVPFELNPIYSDKLNSNNESFDTDVIDKYTRLNDLLNTFHYDFNLERSIVGYSDH